MSIDYRGDNTIIFTLARMNPPTPGHLFLIQQLIQEAIEKNVQEVYIILSKTNDNNENPIPCPEKINVLGDADDVTKTMIQSLKEKMIAETEDETLKTKIRNMIVHTICVPDEKRATPFTPLFPIVGEKVDTIPDVNLFLIIGDDRKNMLDSITDFFFKWDNVHSVNGKILPRDEMSEYKAKSKDPKQLESLVISEVPLNAMSASFVRNIVKNERMDKFHELYSPYLDEEKIPRLYESIKTGLTLPPNTKSDGPEKPLKYSYPMIKGVSKLPSKSTKSGGRRKTKKYKKSKNKYNKKKFSKKRILKGK
jgi:nicotinic acid mononucleotide adenylyltransferase